MSQDDLNHRLQMALSEGTANLSRTLMGMKVHTGYTHAGGPRPRPLGRSAALYRHAMFFVCLSLMRFLSSSVVTLWAHNVSFSVLFCRHALSPQRVVFCPLLSSRFGPTVCRFLSSSVVTLWAHSVSFSVLFCRHALSPQRVVFCPILSSRFGPTVCRFLSSSVVTLWAHSVSFSFLFCRHALGPQCVVFCPLLSSRFGPTVWGVFRPLVCRHALVMSDW